MTQNEIPKPLVDEVRNGRAVLVLGAGASEGATTGDGKQFPTTRELAKAIASSFLGTETADDLAWTAELAVSETSVAAVQEFIASLFANPIPAKHHKLLPTFRWRGLATTNYDLVIETTYERAAAPIQHVVPFLSNNDRVDSRLRDQASLALLKLHGCVSRIDDPNLRLILTPDQYVTHERNRHRLFNMLQEWASENTLVFVGHSVRDSDLRKLLIRVVEQLGGHPRFYMVRPDVTQQESAFWAGKNITVLNSTFADFLQRLDVSIVKAFRPLLRAIGGEHPIVKHFIVDTTPTPALLEGLQNDLEYVHAGMTVEVGDPKRFYSGFSLGWYPIQAHLDVRRRLGRQLLDDIVLRPEDDRPTTVELYVVKAEAGSGKSVLLRRVAWDAAVEAGALVFYVVAGRMPDASLLQEIGALTGQRLFLFLEHPAVDPRGLIRLLAALTERGVRVTVVTGERANEWNVRCDGLEEYLSGEYALHYLSENELGALVDLLKTHDALGSRLEKLSRDAQIEEFAKQADRQILVALHVATLGKPFEDILLDEYRRVLPAEAQRLYLTVCVLNRLGVPVRAGVISRVHGIPFEVFKERFFRPLEHVVRTVTLPWGDPGYKARHTEIADIVFQRVLTEPHDRFNEVVRTLRGLNPMYATDWIALRGLLRARTVLEVFPSHEDALALYEAAEEVAGEEDVYLLHQRANYERLRPNGNLKLATALLERAKDADPSNATVVHTLAEVMRSRAEAATEALERARFRREAMSLLAQIGEDGPSAQFVVTTRLKLAIDGLRDTIADREASDRDLDEAVRLAEREVEDAHQRYPGNAYVATLDSELGAILEDHERAQAALANANAANRRDPFIAARLAAMVLRKGRVEDARAIIVEALRGNRADKRLNHMYAEIERVHGAGQSREELVHHYRRAFTRWDRNYESQFWFARFAWEGPGGELIREAKDVFRHLREARVPHQERTRIRDFMQGADGPQNYSGSMARVEAAHAFVKVDGRTDWLYVHRGDVREEVWTSLRRDRRVRFRIGFALGGPRALEMWLEGGA